MRLLIIILSISSLWLGGCGKKAVNVADSVSSTESTGSTPNAPDGQFDDGAEGGIADFFPEGSSDSGKARSMEKYVYERALNNPNHFKIRLNLKEESGGLYTGHLNISYYDNGYYYQSNQDTGFSKVDVKYSKYDGDKEYKYNKWFSSGGSKKFRAMFSDSYGAVIVVIDDVLDLGDGLGPDDKVGGKIYYKNFGNLYAPSSPTRCWFVYAGPYDCQAGYEGSSRLYPSGGYTLLGKFKNLSLKQAFNLD